MPTPAHAELLHGLEQAHFGPARSAEPEFSLISPTFKRPDEVREFIASAESTMLVLRVPRMR